MTMVLNPSRKPGKPKPKVAGVAEPAPAAESA
jgi:hypothetical protein